MAYCLGTLVEIVEQILHPDKHHKHWVLDPDKRPQLQSLFENAYFLRNFLANLSPESRQAKLECFEDRIRDAAETAEDILEKHITDLVLSSRSWSQSVTISPPDLQQVIEQLEITKEKMMEIMGPVSSKFSSEDDAPYMHKEPDPAENTTFGGVVDAAAGQEQELRKDDVYSDLEACVALMKDSKHTDLRYMCHLLNSTTEEMDSKSDIESSPSDGPNRSYTFDEINNDLIQLKDRLIALNLEIFTDIFRTDRIAISEDMRERLKAQLRDAVVAVEHAYESYISVLTLLSRRNYLSTLYLSLLSCKYEPTSSEISSIKLQMTVMAMELIASKVPCRQPAVSLIHTRQPSSLEIVLAGVGTGNLIDVMDQFRDAMGFDNTCQFVSDNAQKVIAKLSRGPQIISEYRNASAMHGQYPMRTMTGLEEDSVQVIQEQFSDELLSGNILLRAIEMHGDDWTTDIHRAIKTAEGFRKPLTDAIQVKLNEMEVMYKKSLDALSSIDDDYLQRNEIIEEASRGVEYFRNELEDIGRAYDSHIAGLNLMLCESDDDMPRSPDVIEEEIDFTNRRGIVILSESIKMTSILRDKINCSIKRVIISRIPETPPVTSSSSVEDSKPSNMLVGPEGRNSSKVKKDELISGEPPNPRYNPRDILVGLTNDVMELESRLARKQSSLQIIPIVGMGGIGKTTLARIIYDKFSSHRSHFDVCAWGTISQQYNVRDILLDLLACISRKPKREMHHMETYHELGLRLHQSLSWRRYLIFLDDIWSPKAWDDIKRFLPDDNKGSKIVLTTRESIMAHYAEPNDCHHRMHLLNEVDSWMLLKQKVYGREACPLELEKVGRRIARNCGGLPLAIQVIGGILSQAERSQSIWEKFASEMSLYVGGNADERLQGVFSSSFDYLPHYLKPCFLYMGYFPEDHTIRASTLIKLWIAEGFLYPIQGKSLEEAAATYLTNLVERNLIFVREEKSNGEVKSYGIHDLLRNQCMAKAREKKFFNVICNLNEHVSSQRRVSAHSSLCRDKVDLKLARSFWCSAGYATECFSHSFVGSQLSLLRVLDVLQIRFPEFPKEILQLINLRYLALYCRSGILERIFVLRNLQTLIFQFSKTSHFEARIFDLPQLRHLKFQGPIRIDKYRVCRRYALLENLQSLFNIPLDLINLVLGAAPNLKKLGIKVTLTSRVYHITDLTCFHKLETLLIANTLFSTGVFDMDKLVFPPSLRKLTLTGCKISSSCLRKVGELANLEVLKLHYVKFVNCTWEPSEREFCKLKFLLFEYVDLVDWLADESCFPVLQHLVLQFCDALKEIPDIGGIPTLEIIDVLDCATSVEISAKAIQKEQQYYGNSTLQVRIL